MHVIVREIDIYVGSNDCMAIVHEYIDMREVIIIVW